MSHGKFKYKLNLVICTVFKGYVAEITFRYHFRAIQFSE